MVLIIGSIQYVSGDHSLGDDGIFKDETHVNIADSIGSKWLIHVQLVVQNTEGQLINVSESTHGSYIPHKVTDYIFDEYLGKKEIVVVDNIKYEKIQFSDSYGYTANSITYHDQYLFDTYDREPTGRWVVEICGESLNKFGFNCAEIFQSRTSIVWLEMGDVTTSNWTILKKIN